jgi:hypothetical protein
MHPHMRWFHTPFSQHSMCTWPLMAHTRCTRDDVSLHTINCSPFLLGAWSPNFSPILNYRPHTCQHHNPLHLNTDMMTFSHRHRHLLSPFDLLHDLFKVYIPWAIVLEPQTKVTILINRRHIHIHIHIHIHSFNQLQYMDSFIAACRHSLERKSTCSSHSTVDPPTSCYLQLMHKRHDKKLNEWPSTPWRMNANLPACMPVEIPQMVAQVTWLKKV